VPRLGVEVDVLTCIRSGKSIHLYFPGFDQSLGSEALIGTCETVNLVEIELDRVISRRQSTTIEINL
jgi:hypothetical protein